MPDKPVLQSASPDITQPDTTCMILYVPLLYLITHDLVNKLCNCESTYLERVDDVRDEMVN